ncbi:hypothetical protein [Curtobacterium sp. BRB10]|uniref:hypothetical protein n=1 Tax=Curtobacterium sp. BRB10 TaxID=2962579 RepID=UPI002881D1AB|nr:hypothetical protein [Curtobacterium sp. BRB10]MDT0234797.1 hypothetical protein [Curtobacterium sp. BRB10]
MLVALVVYFSVARHTFLSTGNFVSMGTSVGYLLAGSVGLAFVILAGSIDLSVGATVLLSSAVVALGPAGTAGPPRWGSPWRSASSSAA